MYLYKYLFVIPSVDWDLFTKISMKTEKMWLLQLLEYTIMLHSVFTEGLRCRFDLPIERCPLQFAEITVKFSFSMSILIKSDVQCKQNEAQIVGLLNMSNFLLAEESSTCFINCVIISMFIVISSLTSLDFTFFFVFKLVRQDKWLALLSYEKRWKLIKSTNAGFCYYSRSLQVLLFDSPSAYGVVKSGFVLLSTCPKKSLYLLICCKNPRNAKLKVVFYHNSCNWSINLLMPTQIVEADHLHFSKSGSVYH